MACPLAEDSTFWTDKAQYADAECNYYMSKRLVETLEPSETIAPLTKKAKKNKKEKKEAAATEVIELGETEEPHVTSKVACGDSNPIASESSNNKKSKKEKQKNKQATKSPTNESIETTKVEPIEVVATATSTTSKKNKKNKEKAKNNASAAVAAADEELAKKANAMQNAPKDIGVANTKESKESKNNKKLATLNKNNDAAGTANGQKDDKQGGSGQCTLATEIAKAREHIKNSLDRMDGIAALAASPGAELLDRLSTVEKENAQLREVVNGLQKLVLSLSDRVAVCEGKVSSSSTAAKAPQAATKAPVAAKAADKESEDDDGVDLFGSDSDEDSAEAAAVKEKLLADYAAKKSKKPALIAKSNIILDVKPWDDETDMAGVEASVRKIVSEGLLWGASKLVPLAYGIHKLQISTVVVDDLISVDWLTEEIESIEDVQSVDIAAFNKI